MKPERHQFEDKLLEFAYGELPAHEAGAVEAHLRGCERCRRELEQLQAVRSTMQRLPLEEVPAAGLESLLAYAQAQAGRNARAAPRPWWRLPVGGRWLAPLASAAALTLVATVAWKTQDAFTPDPTAAALQAEADRAPAPAAVAAVVPQPPPEPEAAALERETGARQAQVGRAEALARKADQPRERQEEKALKVIGSKPASSQAAGPAAVGALEEARADYSNAAALGGSAAGASPAPAQGYGLGSAGAVQPVVRRGGEQRAAPSREVTAPRDEAGPAALAVAPAPVAAPTGLASADSPAASEPPPAAPPKAESLGLSLAKKKGAVAAADRAEAAPAKAPGGGNLALAEALASARQAGGAGDRAGELRHALAALQAGAAGAVRAEMLSRGCGAAEALGELEQADRLCDQLLSEYPASPAAEALAARRSRVQTVPIPASKAAPQRSTPPPVKK